MMKNLFTTLFTLIALTVQAQYLPNGSFDSWKGSCGDTYQSSRTEYRKRPGDEPTSWNGSSINQKVSIATKSETLIYKSTGRNGSAVKMQNKYVGALGIGSNAPGFISFATPWVYAVTKVANCDGGVYGGMSFTHRPDAIKGWFKRTGGTGEKAHIIVYLWKGTFKNNIASDKSNDTKEDTDRAVMGTVSSTGNGVRIASCDYTFTTTTNNDWQEIVVPLNYENDYIPEKVNVILSSGDYWTRDNMKDGSILEVDDVEFVYYSELASLVYNGKNYYQAGKTSYTIDEFYDESKLSLTSNGRGAVIEKSFDSTTNVLTITVKGNDCATSANKISAYRIDDILAQIKEMTLTSSNYHTYTVNFKTEEPLTVVSVTPDEAVESLKTITVVYSDEIAGTYSASAASKIYVGSSNNTASFSVSGKMLTITLDKAITTQGEYALYIPEGLVTRKSNGKAVTCNGEVKFAVIEPFEVVAVTPNEAVDFLKTITVEYNDEIAGTYNEGAASKIYVGSSSNTASFSVSGKVLTITLANAITVPGEHALYIPAGLVTRKVNGAAVTCDGEIKFSVKEPPVDAPLLVVATTPSEAVESLKTITIEYNEEIAGTYDASAASKIYVGSSSNTASFSVNGAVLTITLDNAITTPGEYALYIPEGLVTRKSNGKAVTCDGELEFTVKAIPLAVVAVTPNVAVESLERMTIEYNDEIVGTYDASAASKIYVGSSSNTASFSVSGKVLTITLDNAIATTGKYALYIPAGLITRKINGEAVTCNGEIKFAVDADVDYTPPFTGRKTRTERYISSVTLSSGRYPDASSNTFTVDNSGTPCYSDYTSTVVMKSAPGETVTLAINDDDATSWMHAYVYIDADEDGFTAGIEAGSNWQPAGDLVSYSFYNNDSSSDEKGWDSAGNSITGDARSTVALPEFAVPVEPGVYRMRVKLDWCNIDPAGDSDGKFGDFMDNGGHIVDFMLFVIDEEVAKPDVDVDYTPAYNGTRNYSERDINAINFVSAEYGDESYDLTASERSSEYLDLTGTVAFTAAPGETVMLGLETGGSWINHYVYIDYDADGFTASIEAGSNWKPAEDLVAYSFYNNGGSSDESGWNSDGISISGDDRSYPPLPSFVVPSEPGVYRMRIKQDWCSIDPAGDSDSNFGGTFSNYGGQIIDVLLNVLDPTSIEDVEAESEANGFYDMQGRKLSEIVKSGIYIINGKKVLVK